ncbi:MAG: hypothetical protein IMW91_07275 [Firmicutes bacterium]|nr:hypothetical protein [Bacillota bacterium]
MSEEEKLPGEEDTVEPIWYEEDPQDPKRTPHRHYPRRHYRRYPCRPGYPPPYYPPYSPWEGHKPHPMPWQEDWDTHDDWWKMPKGCDGKWMPEE